MANISSLLTYTSLPLSPVGSDVMAAPGVEAATLWVAACFLRSCTNCSFVFSSLARSSLTASVSSLAFVTSSLSDAISAFCSSTCAFVFCSCSSTVFFWSSSSVMVPSCFTIVILSLRASVRRSL